MLTDKRGNKHDPGGVTTAGDRREIWLDETDVVAAAQILAWIAFPDRPEHGVALLNQWYWARRHWRGETVPDLPFKLKRKSVLEPQIANFVQKLKEGFRAGHWFQMQCLENVDTGEHFPIPTRVITDNFEAMTGRDAGNVSKAIRSKRRPVWHIASAAHRAAAYRNGGCLPDEFERLLFDPAWLESALFNAERYVARAARLGAFGPSQFYLFRRDSF